MPTVLDYDMHDLGETSFRSLQERIIRERQHRLHWNPTASSLTRQAWDYQQKLADLMGEVPSMGDVSSDAQAKLDRIRQIAGIDESIVSTCGKAALIAAFAGFVAGKVGLAKTVLGVGAVYLVSEWIGKK